MVESAAECSVTLQGKADLGHDEVQRMLQGFPSSVCDLVFCAGSGNPYDENGDGIAGVSFSPDRKGRFLF